MRPTLKLHDPQLVRVQGATRYVAVPPELTAPTPAPVPPVPLCLSSDGVPVLCDTQLALWLRELEFGALGSCNADKAAIALLPATPQ